ncbi:RICIN domain-containing protein [Streptomyces sp. DSM 44915]|uniref:RICIN domain-containing protein n=1 Tax=Streptomyces chisholmiae TaxID=3075540 RepID=A0ABU2JPT4_9ACTN|nr:RICIN domain-containing protein [Streptomyces sp. DSM 44915]MDT0267012.1 RICIN domain-containing protein [Streptomyces sp. DSM 44915]
MSTDQAETADGEGFAPRISTIAGTGTAGFAGDDEAAVSAQFKHPYEMAVSSTGILYVSDYSNHRVRRITTDGKISTVAGTGVAGSGGDGGPAAKAQLNCPRQIAADRDGSVYIADAGGHRVRRIGPDGIISTVAGTGTAGSAGDEGPAVKAQLNKPFGVAVDADGVLYVSEFRGHRVRRIGPDGIISTVAGTGTAGSAGDEGPAVKAQLNSPYGITVDSTGILYIADSGRHRVRRIGPDGIISTVAGTGTAGDAGDEGPADKAQLNKPYGITVDSTGVLYVSEYGGHRVRRIGPDGIISTVAGTGTAGSAGDGGPAAEAQLNCPFGLTVDSVDALYIADHLNHRIRKVTSALMAGLPDTGSVVALGNVRSRLRAGVVRESTKDGSEIHQSLPSPRAHQQWRLVVAGQDDGEVLYRIENLRSGKALEVVGGGTAEGAVVAQRTYEGTEASHQHWRLIPTGPAADSPRVYEIANRNSGLLLSISTRAPSVLRQFGAQGDHRDRQWQLLPV